MKAGRSVDGIVYPDVGHQISELVSQQPGETPEAERAQAIVPRRRMDDYKPIVATLNKLEQLTKKELPPLSTFGYVPRPDGWQRSAAIFHDPTMRQELKGLAFSFGAETKLQELADDLVADSQETPLNLQHLLTNSFRGIVFPAGADSMQEPLKFVQERSLSSLDELRQKLFDPRTGGAEKSSALLQFRAKLDCLTRLSEWIQNSFADLDYVELSRVKAPILC